MKLITFKNWFAQLPGLSHRQQERVRQALGPHEPVVPESLQWRETLPCALYAKRSALIAGAIRRVRSVIAVGTAGIRTRRCRGHLWRGCGTRPAG